jgi:hypothetical protein
VSTVAASEEKVVKSHITEKVLPAKELEAGSSFKIDKLSYVLSFSKHMFVYDKSYLKDQSNAREWSFKALKPGKTTLHILVIKNKKLVDMYAQPLIISPQIWTP